MWEGADDYPGPDPEVSDKKNRARIGETRTITLQKLRKEFPLGNLSCRSQSWNYPGNVVIFYITVSKDLVGTIYTELRKDGSLEVFKILPVVDQEGSQPLIKIAEREKIP